MGLGSTAKKIQTLADRAEQLYIKLKEVHERVLSVETTVEETQDQVDALERELDHQRIVLEAIAEDRGLDVDELVADAAIEDIHTDDAADDPTDESTGDGASAESAGGDGTATDAAGGDGASADRAGGDGASADAAGGDGASADGAGGDGASAE